MLTGRMTEFGIGWKIDSPILLQRVRRKGSDAMEDSRIIDLFFERSEQAIEELDRKYGPAVRKTAANILNDRHKQK